MQLGRVDPPGDLGQLGRGDVAEALAEPFQLRVEPEHRLQHLGVGLGRAADQQALVAGAEALLAVGAVEAEPNDRGPKPSRSAAGLRRHRHLEEGLSRVGCRPGAWPAAEAPVPAADRRATPFLSAPDPRSNSAAATIRARGGGPDRQPSYDPLRHSLVKVRATR